MYPSAEKKRGQWHLTLNEWIIFSIAVAGFLLSLRANAVQLDEVRMVVDSIPTFLIDKHENKVILAADEDFGIIFINAGTRPVAILIVSLMLGEATVPLGDARSRDTECNQRILCTTFESFVLKEKEIVRKLVRIKVPVVELEDATLRNGKIEISTPDLSRDEDRVFFSRLCMNITGTTPSRPEFEKEIDIKTQVYSCCGGGGEGYEIGPEPYLLWKEYNFVI